jgi:hypothetical protein
VPGPRAASVKTSGFFSLISEDVVPGDVVRLDVGRNLQAGITADKKSKVGIQKSNFDMDIDMNFDMGLPRHGKFRAQKSAIFEIPIFSSKK